MHPNTNFPRDPTANGRLASLPTELILQVALSLYGADLFRFAAITTRNWAILRKNCDKMIKKVATPTPEDYAEYAASLHDDGITSSWTEDKWSAINTRSRFLHVVYAGYLRAAESFLKHGIDANACTISGMRALHQAMNSGSKEEMTMLLLKYGADPNLSELTSRQMTPLHLAAINAEDAVAHILMAHGADANHNDTFHHLCTFCKKETVQYAVDGGADLRKLNGSGNSVIHCAAKNEDTGVLRLFFDLGIVSDYLELQNRSGKTPLIKAVIANRLDNVRLLIEYGADVNARYAQGTVLNVACSNECVEVAALLIEAGADPDVLGPDGRTPLHHATQIPSIELVRRLLKAGANVTIADSDTKTALHIAYSLMGNDYIDQNEVIELTTILVCALQTRHSEMGRILYEACVAAVREGASEEDA